MNKSRWCSDFPPSKLRPVQNSAGRHDNPSPPARRISVVGPSGSGKSVLSRSLAERLSLQHVELDRIRQAHASDAEFIRRVGALTAEPAWIVDGHYRLVRENIWRRADMIVWLNYPLGFVLFRLFGRFAARRRGASLSVEESSERTGVTPPASWPRRFARLARTVRERGEYRALLTEAAQRGAIVVELRSETETRSWLESRDRGDAGREGRHHARR